MLPAITFAALAGHVQVVEFFLKLNDLDLGLRGVSDLSPLVVGGVTFDLY